MENANQSPRWSFNGPDIIHIAKVLGWTLASSAIGFAITQLPLLDVPAQYAAIAALVIPFINTLLVAAQRFAAGKAK